MLTPQEVSEHAFTKASFGGYNMAMVDEFLDVLTGDYTALYKENAVLKSKMKVLADKLEDYRATEDAMRKALLTAQRLADEMVQEAEQKKTQILAQAEVEARAKIGSLRADIDGEARRLSAAKTVTDAYVAKLREMCAKELEYLTQVDQILPPVPDPVVTAAQDISATMDKMSAAAGDDALDDTKDFIPRPEPAPEADGAESPRAGGLYDDIAAFAAQAKGGLQEQRIEITLGQPHPEWVRPIAPEAPGEAPAAPADNAPTRPIDFDHLQFGKDYEIK